MFTQCNSMKRSNVIQLSLGTKLNIRIQQCKRALAVALPTSEWADPKAGGARAQGAGCMFHSYPYESTVHCTHIDNDKYMGIIKSWNLFLCAYNRGQLTHPCAPSHTVQTPKRPIMQAAPQRRISSKNTENVICLKVPKPEKRAMSPCKCVKTTTITVTRQNKQLWAARRSRTLDQEPVPWPWHAVTYIASNALPAMPDKVSAANFRILPIFV